MIKLRAIAVLFAYLSVLAATVPEDARANQGFVPIQAPKKVLRGLPTYRFDTRVLNAQIDKTVTARPTSSPMLSSQPDFAAQLNNLQPGRVLADERIAPAQSWGSIGATGWYPPDPDIAVGPSHVVQVANSSIAWFDRSGAIQFQQTSATFFSNLYTSSFLFDPKAFYDPVNRRFVILFLERDTNLQTSHLLIAVSDDDNPNGSWYRYRIETTLTINSTKYWLDYPGFGYSNGAYVVSGNMFGFSSGWAGVQFITIPTTPLLSGSTASAVSLLDSSGASAQVAEDLDGASGTAYAVSRSGSSALRIYAIESPETLSPVLFSSNVTVPSNSSPATDATSTGGYLLDTIDGRVFNAALRGGKLVTAHNSTPSTGAPVAVRWYEVNVGNWPVAGSAIPSLAQAGLVSASDTHYFTPAISKNPDGDIAILFSASSGSVTANIMTAGRKATDPSGYMGVPAALKESPPGTNYSQGRWGDYFGVDVDPADPTQFVGVGEYVAANNAWATEVVQWRVSAGETQPPNTPQGLSAVATAANSVTVTWLDTIGEAGYVLERAPQGGSYAEVATPAMDAVRFVDTSGIAAATTYSYRIKAYNAGGSSSFSSAVSVTTPDAPPSAPTNFVIATTTRSLVRLNWTDVANETGYRIERSTNSKTWSQIASLPAGSVSFDNTGLKANTTYYYRIRAFNLAGNSNYAGPLTAKTLR